MRLCPFRGAKQARLFAVPCRKNNGALRLPALLQEFTETASFLQYWRHARDRILRPVHPAIVMIAANHPLVRIGGARDASNHVVRGLVIPVKANRQMDFGQPRTDVIGDGQSTTPFLWSHRTG